MAQPPDSYRNDHSKMVVQLARPRRRATAGERRARGIPVMRIEADLDLCQGHAMCELEAPDYFPVPQGQGRDPRRRAARGRHAPKSSGPSVLPHPGTMLEE